MRYLLPVVAVATALSVGVWPAAAKQSQHQQQPDNQSQRQHQRQHPAKRANGHVTLHVSTHTVVRGDGIAVRGKVRPSGRQRVKIVFRGAGSGALVTTTRPNGTFAERWVPERIGNYRVRAYGIHSARASGSDSPARRLTAYRPAGASYYGPGLYGNGVACGGTLMPGTMGVAHKTLPCGTKVKIRYHGRSVTVPVIDRGPYVAGRDYDLTEATRNRLGFPGVGTVLANH
jgi:rare lipoprotein A (peptidoglycan hydrolase)